MTDAPAIAQPPELRASLALAGGAFAVAAALSYLRIGHGAPDFYVFWAAARHAAAPYDPAIVSRLLAQLHLTGVWPFAYPPSFLIFVWPFAEAPLALAYPLWAGLSAGLFAFAATRIVRPPWAAAGLFLALPVFAAAELGQVSLPIGAALILGFFELERRPRLAGVLFALAACMKPQAMLLAPIVLFGRWRTLACMAGVGAAVCMASLGFGLQPWLDWPRAVRAFAEIAPQADRANPSALLPGLWWPVLTALAGAAFAWKNRNLLGLVGGSFLATPYAHAYDLAPLAPVALAWLLSPREAGLARAGAGAALLAGVVATPLASLLFFAVLGLSPVIRSRGKAALQPPQQQSAAGGQPA